MVKWLLYGKLAYSAALLLSSCSAAQVSDAHQSKTPSSSEKRFFKIDDSRWACCARCGKPIEDLLDGYQKMFSYCAVAQHALPPLRQSQFPTKTLLRRSLLVDGTHCLQLCVHNPPEIEKLPGLKHQLPEIKRCHNRHLSPAEDPLIAFVEEAAQQSQESRFEVIGTHSKYFIGLSQIKVKAGINKKMYVHMVSNRILSYIGRLVIFFIGRMLSLRYELEDAEKKKQGEESTIDERYVGMDIQRASIQIHKI